MKICKKCQVNKPLDDFYNSPQNLYGKSHYCKECYKAHVKEYKKNNPDKQMEYVYRSNFKKYAKIIGKDSSLKLLEDIFKEDE